MTRTSSRAIRFFMAVAILAVTGTGAHGQFSIGGSGKLGDVLGTAQSGFKGVGALAKAMKQMDPEAEYHLGRAVAAKILSKYGAYEDEQANRYVNQVGHALAEFSQAPEVYSDYHFQILESDDVNAFAAPGAFIFITRGMLRVCTTEDELAAVLAHEIGHIQRKHALKSIKKSRWLTFGAVLASEGSGRAGRGQSAKFGKMFEGMVGDVAKTMMVNGYGRELEKEADGDAASILLATGYDPSAIISVLEKMKKVRKRKSGFFKTHPKPSARIKSIKSLITTSGQSSAPSRQARFDAALSGVRAG